MSQSDSRRPRKTSYRSYHRAQAHASAHAEDAAPQAIPRHELIPHNKPAVITDAAGLAGLIEELRAAGSFAYDSEFIGELSYVPRLCLIQVATAQRVTLIDPLTGLDLTDFWALICDPAVEKIVHAGQQDIEPVFRHLPEQRPANLIDTQIAAGFAALPYPVSLSKLVGEMTGVRLSKGFTFTNWEHRPLSSSQLRYAADDVRYLPLVWHTLRQRLEALGHLEAAREACAALLDPALYAEDPDGGYLRIRGAGSLDPKNLAVLRELAIWRDQSARQEDIPARTLLRDEVLLALARHPVKSVDKLAAVKGLPRPVETQYGRELVDRTLRALALPRDQWPVMKNNEETAAEKFQTDALLTAAEAVCFGKSIDPALVLSRQDIADLLRRRRQGQPIDESRLLHGWRRHIVGEALLKLLDHQPAGEIRWAATTPPAQAQPDPK